MKTARIPLLGPCALQEHERDSRRRVGWCGRLFTGAGAVAATVA